MAKAKSAKAESNGHTPATPASANVINAVDAAVADLVTNEYLFRRNVLSMYLDKRRDIGRECGYPDTNEEIEIVHYKKLYSREPLARRVNNLYPNECWQVYPEICEDENVDVETPFEAALKEVAMQLAGTSFYKGAEGNQLWEYLKRADRLSGVGRYGIILIGTDDRQLLDQPLDIDEDGKPAADRKLLFLRVLDEEDAKIVDTEKNEKDKRFGKPVMYSLTLSKPGQSGNSSTVTQRVHWTRIIHLCDGDDIYAEPRLLVHYNRLYDLHKLYGGSAEMYWKGAFYGISFETHPDMSGRLQQPTPEEVTRFKRQIEDYENSLSRSLITGNMSAKTLTPQVVDPSKHIDGQIEAICIERECPKRIFMGSERGELSSDQDSKTWYGVKVPGRQNGYVTPRILVPVVDRFIQIGILPAPSEYHAEWPCMITLSDLEKADVALKNTQAMAAYVAGNVEALVAPLDYLMRVVGYDKETAEAILENRGDSLELKDALAEYDHDPSVQFAPDGTPIGPDAKPIGPKMAAPPKPFPPK